MATPARQPSRRASERNGVMPIENREPAAGTRLVACYKKQERTCEVVETADGLRYRLDDGTEHRSPSSAGKAVTGGACNGWVFWSLSGDETAKPKKAKAAKAPAATKPAKAKAPPKKGATAKRVKPKKAKAMRAAASGESYGCGVCPETFPTLKDATAHALTHTTA
jgi:hypothetical protein